MRTTQTNIAIPRTVDELALQAALNGEASGVRVFRLVRHKENEGVPVSVVAFGCQGDGPEYQKVVAKKLQNRFETIANVYKPREINEAVRHAATRLTHRSDVNFRRNAMNFSSESALTNKSKTASQAKAPKTSTRGLPDFILLLGDNVYKFGLSTPTDIKANKYFFEPYAGNKDCPLLGERVYFSILGNHDYPKEKVTATISAIISKFIQGYDPGSYGNESMLAQLAHTYVHVDTEQFNTDLNTFLNSPYNEAEKAAGCRELVLDDLVQKRCFNLHLRRFYSLIIEDTQYFCIDSSTFPQEFLAYKQAKREGRELDPNTNQVAFLVTEVKKAIAEKRTLMLACHHSIITDGPRHKKDDRKQYMSPTTMEALEAIFKDDNEIEDIFSDAAEPVNPPAQVDAAENKERAGKTDPNMNNTLFNCLVTLGLIRKDKRVFNSIITAHDHNNSNFCTVGSPNPNEYQFCQFTAGGGSTRDLQTRERLSNQQYRGCFLRKPGFLEISHYRHDDSSFTFLSADGENTLRFSSSSPRAIVNMNKFADGIEYKQAPQKEDSRAMNARLTENSEKLTAYKQKVQGLFTIVDISIQEYFNYLMRESKVDKAGIDLAHELWAYICEAEPTEIYYGNLLRQIIRIARKDDALLNTLEIIASKMLQEDLKTHLRNNPPRKETTLTSSVQAIALAGGSPISSQPISAPVRSTSSQSVNRKNTSLNGSY